MIKLYVKFNMYSSNAKKVIVPKVSDRWTDGGTDGRQWASIGMMTIGIRQNLKMMETYNLGFHFGAYNIAKLAVLATQYEIKCKGFRFIQ